MKLEFSKKLCEEALVCISDNNLKDYEAVEYLADLFNARLQEMLGECLIVSKVPVTNNYWKEGPSDCWDGDKKVWIKSTHTARLVDISPIKEGGE